MLPMDILMTLTTSLLSCKLMSNGLIRQYYEGDKTMKMTNAWLLKRCREILRIRIKLTHPNPSLSWSAAPIRLSPTLAIWAASTHMTASSVLIWFLSFRDIKKNLGSEIRAMCKTFSLVLVEMILEPGRHAPNFNITITS